MTRHALIEGIMTPGVLTRTKKHSKTEKGTEPLPTANSGLNRLLTEWNKTLHQAEDYWRRIVEFCGENDITNQQLTQALIDIRGMAEVTATNEAAKILKAAHIEEAVQALEDGATVDSVKKDILPKYEAVKGQKHVYREKIGESRPDRETQLNKQLQKIASLFISELEMLELNDFMTAARKAWKIAFATIEKKARKDQEHDKSRIEEEESRLAAAGVGDSEEEDEG
jgi:hypothetical protein